MKVIWRQIECLFLDLGCICFGSIVFMRYTAQAQANAVQHTFTPVWGWTAALHPFADFEHIDIGNEGPSN